MFLNIRNIFWPLSAIVIIVHKIVGLLVVIILTNVDNHEI